MTKDRMITSLEAWARGYLESYLPRMSNDANIIDALAVIVYCMQKEKEGEK